jgi:butyryl-CoA dehydrogenase
VSVIVDPRNLDFVLYELLAIQQLTRYPRFASHTRETFDAAIDLAHQLALEQFLPHNRKSDAEEPHVVDGRVRVIPEVRTALSAYLEAGFIAMLADESAGGMQLPYTLSLACDMLFYGANVATSGYVLLSKGAANLLEAHGSEEQKQRWMRPIHEGRYFGTMCLSEPQAGSSLADIRTVAHPAPEGHYLLSGAKMWISGGEHEMAENIVHLVLAKLPDAPPGVRGISLFIVPRVLLNEDGSPGVRNDIKLAGVNHKMGQRGLINTFLKLGEEGRCVGYLIGAPHTGLAQMFHMMNEARISVGASAAMLGYAGYLYSLGYARERLQGRHPDQKNPAAPQLPLIEHADIRRMLLQQRAYVEGGHALSLYAATLVDAHNEAQDETARHESGLLLDLLTPVVKAWCSDWCLKANELAIQILGGYGYTREYPVEQLYRDNRLNPIHEGTNGIQAIDLLGRKAMMENGAALKLLLREMQATVALAKGLQPCVALAASLSEHAATLERVTAFLAEALGSGKLRHALSLAPQYLLMLGHVVVAWIWLRQAVVAAKALDAGTAEPDFYRGKLHTAQYFFRQELPLAALAAQILLSLDDTILETRAEWF